MNKYPSRYSPGKMVTASQYIVEYICEKKAKREGKDLPTQFWVLPEWAKFYKSQIHTANALVKKYGAEVVLSAVKNEQSSWMYSLRAPGFEAIILTERRNASLRETAKQAESKTEASEIPVVDITAKPRQFKAKTKLDALEDL